MSLVKIHGFLAERQTCKPEFGNITVEEVVLVEMSTPTDTIIDVLSALPAYPASPSASNPLGLDFTFEVSTHPETTALILREAGSLEQAPQGGIFWHVPLVYKIHEASTAPAGSNPNPKRRKDQIIVDPTSRPAVYNYSTKTVSKGTYTKPDGTVILHTNGQPLTEMYMYEDTHEVHTFSKNLTYSTFNQSDYSPYIGTVSSATVFGLTGQKVKLASVSFSEEYESAGAGVSKTEFHFMRGTFVFEVNNQGWTDDSKLVSRSTLARGIVGPPASGPIPIVINERGDYATSPWPLDASGDAIPFDNINPANFGYVNTGYPYTSNLATLVSSLGLTIP